MAAGAPENKLLATRVDAPVDVCWTRVAKLGGSILRQEQGKEARRKAMPLLLLPRFFLGNPMFPNTCPLCGELLHRFDSPTREEGTPKELAHHVFAFHHYDDCPCTNYSPWPNRDRVLSITYMTTHFSTLVDLADHLRYHTLAASARASRASESAP